MSIEEILEKHELFKRLSRLERTKLAETGSERALEPKTLLFRQGEATDGMYLLLDGAVELSRLNRLGRRFVLARLQPDDTFGELGILDCGPRAVTAETVQATRLVFFSLEGIDALRMRHDRAALELLHVLSVQASRRLRELNRAIVESLNEPTAITGQTLQSGARPDRDFFHGLMAGLFARPRGERP